MKKTFALLILVPLVVSFQSFGQGGSYNVDPSTKLVTNFNERYTFSYVYSYDFDLKKSSQPYRANCLVIIEINGIGIGRLITALDGDKNVLTIVSCHRYDGYYEFEATNKYGTTILATLSIINGHIDRFWVVDVNNIAFVFAN